MPKPVNANPMNVNALMQHPLAMFAHPPSLMQFGFGQHHDPRMPPMQPGPVQGNPGTQGPQVPNTQFPLNPGAPIQGQQYPMVGSSYNVLGMHPATSPFGLPTY